jgi:ABC-type molybdate transport system substrate-binding protein
MTITAQYRDAHKANQFKSGVARDSWTTLGIGKFRKKRVQGLVVLARSPHKKEAAEFVEHIKTKEAAEVLRKYGSTVPQN